MKLTHHHRELRKQLIQTAYGTLCHFCRKPMLYGHPHLWTRPLLLARPGDTIADPTAEQALSRLTRTRRR